jgi:glycosyltransferase involved in cell wall biosynthesis
MKLLIITQVIDVNHPILGFFHRWVQEFAKHYEHVHVICLQAGKHSLPANVTVHSLGKEKGVGKLGYLINFYKLIWRLRHDYDHVFVHMNQIYVILGAPFWRAARKKIGLWYTHGTVSHSLRIATKLTHKVFTASSESFNIDTPKKQVTGHGIDTGDFHPIEGMQKELDLITVGRVSPVKQIEFLIDALAEVRKTNPVTLTIVGPVVDEKGKEYQSFLQQKCAERGVTDVVIFHGPLSPSEMKHLLNRSKVFVTASKTGSLDKVVLEAMACGLPIVSSATGTTSLPLGQDQVTTVAECATAVTKVIESGNYQRQDYVAYIMEQHSLTQLIAKIHQQYV